jgi:hypothetical protein
MRKRKKNFDFLQMVAESDPEMAKIVQEIRDDYASGRSREQPWRDGISAARGSMVGSTFTGEFVWIITSICDGKVRRCAAPFRSGPISTTRPSDCWSVFLRGSV